MKLPEALTQLATAAQAVVASLENHTVELIEKPEKPGLRLPNGELVLDYARKLYIHSIAAWMDDRRLESAKCIDLEVDVEINDEQFYLVYWADNKQTAIVWPSNGGAGNCPWRIQELKPDSTIDAFLQSRGII